MAESKTQKKGDARLAAFEGEQGWTGRSVLEGECPEAAGVLAYRADSQNIRAWRGPQDLPSLPLLVCKRGCESPGE